jgi:hypothetical protein
MGDVVVKLPIHEGEEAQLFDHFLNTFIERCGPGAEQWAANSDAPYVMVHSEPQPDVDLKVLTFQEPQAANNFSREWDAARNNLTGQVTYLIS